ncbi:hypothetical protein K9M79_08775 [Candidatus Woesearchaeota archaeon]|nr:hypothetical protein [Candidatus Woesearchaeota archaeon]
MEQSMQIIVAVIGIIISVAAIINVNANIQQTAKIDQSEQTLDKFVFECNQMCGSSSFQPAIMTARAPSGSVFYSKGNKICYKFGEIVKCQYCNCDTQDAILLNLSNDIARKAYSSIDIKCNIKKKNVVVINCS